MRTPSDRSIDPLHRRSDRVPELGHLAAFAPCLVVVECVGSTGAPSRNSLFPAVVRILLTYESKIDIDSNRRTMAGNCCHPETSPRTLFRTAIETSGLKPEGRGISCLANRTVDSQTGMETTPDRRAELQVISPAATNQRRMACRDAARISLDTATPRVRARLTIVIT